MESSNFFDEDDPVGLSGIAPSALAALDAPLSPYNLSLLSPLSPPLSAPLATVSFSAAHVDVGALHAANANANETAVNAGDNNGTKPGGDGGAGGCRIDDTMMLGNGTPGHKNEDFHDKSNCGVLSNETGSGNNGAVALSAHASTAEALVARMRSDEQGSLGIALSGREEEAGRLYTACQYAEAEPLLQSLLADRLHNLGETHVDTLKAIDLLASVGIFTYMFDEADSVFIVSGPT
jgi:hypothetical protein